MKDMNGIEAGIILWIQENIRGPIGDEFWQFVTRLGDKGLLWIAMGITLLFFKKTRPIGCTMLLSLLLDFTILNKILKPLIARPRPFVVNEAIVTVIREPDPYRSFPSGHSGGAFAAMFAFYHWVPKKFGIPALFVASMVAVSRLYVGVHYPTDVLAGCLIGLGCSLLAYWIVNVIKNQWEKKHG